MKNIVCDKICDLGDTCGGHCSSNGIYFYTESIIFTVCGVNCITNAFISSVHAFIAFGLPTAFSDSVVCIQGPVIIYAFGIVLQKTELLIVVFCPVDTRGSLPRCKKPWDVKLTTRLHQV